MAQIVYNGVGSGGTLFKDLKFYVVQRIPMRNTFIALIEANGGEVTKVEKNATYVIADHKRQDAPPGSISWNWIEQSVKNGRLEDIEEHPAGPRTKNIREVGSGQRTRPGRVPFTDEDDKVLMKWVSKAERSGLSSKGNDIYKQLEEKNPRHTFQSWRDRWIKQVCKQRRLDLSDDESGPAPPPTRFDSQRAAPPSSSRKALEAPKSRPRNARKSKSPEPDSDSPHETLHSSKRTSQQRDSPKPRSKALQPSSRGGKAKAEDSVSASPPKSQESTEGNPFTNREKKRCLLEYDTIMALDEDQTIDAWVAWARLYPTHTAQEWRNFFKNFIIPIKEKEGEMVAGGGEIKVKSGENHLQPYPETPRDSTPCIKPSPNSARVKVTEIKDSQGPSGETPDSQNHSSQGVDRTTIDEGYFKESLNNLAKLWGREFTYNYTICGRNISIYMLWQVVSLSEFGGRDRVTGLKLWPKVAKKLNFNPFQHKTAAGDLMKCYNEILVDFEEAIDFYKERNASANTPEKTPSETQQMSDQEIQYRQEDELEDADDSIDDLDHPLSTPKQRYIPISAKRSFDESPLNKGVRNGKRQRIDKGKGKLKEVPSTPEDVINGTNTIQQFGPSPPRGSVDNREKSNQMEEEEDVSLVRQTISTALPKRKLQLEPETQDFEFQPLEDVDKSSFVTISTSPRRSKTHTNSNSGDGGGEGEDLFGDDSSTQSLTDSQKILELEAFIDHWVGLGYSEDLVFEALQATSMLQENVGTVVEELTEGNGIPDNVRGVWTAFDDAVLGAGSGSRQFSRLVVKHGAAGVAGRRRFLAEARESELIQ